jgi:hypothetical protein
MVTVTIDELPRQDGFPIGYYRLRYSTVTVTMWDAKLVDGVTVEPISGRTLARLHAAYGSECMIEPWDEETRELVADHLAATGHAARAAHVRGNPPEVPPPPAPALHRAPAPAPAPSSPPAPPPQSAFREIHVEPVEAALPLIDHDVDEISDLNVLRAMASSMGVEVDDRWRAPRLRLEIRKARESAR